MLRAVRELGGLAPVSTEPAPHAERRHMTVMFCDFLGLSALAAELDPEDVAELIRACQGAIAAAVARFDGHVAKWVPDGATIYFGYPPAHEDDAERAVRAGVALVEAITELKPAQGPGLNVRLGISSGLVVVGELIGEGEARERGVVGDTANLAARLSGQLALRQADADRSCAEACFRKAIEIARSQQGRLLELRAANDLARLRRKSNSGGDVRALLEPILETVEGGADTRDVRNAHELLAGLA